MKTIYWRPQTTSPRVLLVISLISLAGLTYLYQFATPSTHGDQEVMAARLAEDFMNSIKAERKRRGHRFDPRFDPHQTGMIGMPISSSTSKVANLSAKQVSVNPNFAAAVVRMLRAAGVREGDSVAIGWTGSFPALNVALCAAIESLDLRPVIVASAASSQYGANCDDFLWLDMEKHLADAGLIRFRSHAMTVGGAADRAFGQSHELSEVAKQAQQRVDVPWLGASRLRESIEARMQLYARASAQPAVAYINVGGGVASMGGSKGSDVLQPGLNASARSLRGLPDCAAGRWAAEGKPVIHLGQARALAKAYGLSTDLNTARRAGSGPLFEQRPPSRIGAAALLLAIGVLLHAFVCRDYGYRGLDWLKAQLRYREPANELRLMKDPIVSRLTV